MRTTSELTTALREAIEAGSISALRAIGEETLGDTRIEVEFIHQQALGNAALREYEYVAAFTHLDRALELARLHQSPSGIARVAQSLGSVHYFIGNYAQALELYSEALGIFESLRHKGAVARLKSNIANVLMYSDEHDQAELLYHEARASADQAGDKLAVARALNNLGLISRDRNAYDQALVYFEESLEILRGLDEYNDVTIVICNICEVQTLHKLTDKFDTYLDELRDRTQDNASMYSAYLNLRCQQESIRGDLDAAWKTNLESIKAARALDSIEPLINAMTPGYALAERRGDLTTYIAYRDEVDRLNAEVRGMDARLRVAFQTKEHEVDRERRKNERERSLLYGALPSSVADRLIAGDDVSGDLLDHVAILFLDIVGFTSISESLPPRELIHLLRVVFRICDETCNEFGVTKIKTIGDSYMAVVGAPDPMDDSASRAAFAAIQIVQRLSDSVLMESVWKKGLSDLRVRVGLHCGPVVAGIVGEERLQYDVWGDTVNIASRMESTGEPGKIHVSEAFAIAFQGEMAKERNGDGVSSPFPIPCSLRERGALEIKGKGTMTTYWLEDAA